MRTKLILVKNSLQFSLFSGDNGVKKKKT